MLHRHRLAPAYHVELDWLLHVHMFCSVEQAPTFIIKVYGSSMNIFKLINCLWNRRSECKDACHMVNNPIIF